MAVWQPYDAFKTAQHNGNALDFDSGTTLKLALVTSSYTPNRATHDFWDDVVANEVSGTNYPAGGVALTTKTLTISNNILTFDADDITINQDAGGFTNARYAILYNDDPGGDASSRLVAYNDLVSDRGNVSNNLLLQFTNGIFTV
jgi:hypothetical protein